MPQASTFVSVPNNGNISSQSIASGMGPPTTKPAEARHLTEAGQAKTQVTHEQHSNMTQGAAEPPTPTMVFHTEAPPSPSTAQ